MCLESASPGRGREGRGQRWIYEWLEGAGGMKGSWALQGSLSPVIPLRERRLALSSAVNAHFTQFAGFPVA